MGDPVFGIALAIATAAATIIIAQDIAEIWSRKSERREPPKSEGAFADN